MAVLRLLFDERATVQLCHFHSAFHKSLFAYDDISDLAWRDTEEVKPLSSFWEFCVKRWLGHNDSVWCPMCTALHEIEDWINTSPQICSFHVPTARIPLPTALGLNNKKLQYQVGLVPNGLGSVCHYCDQIRAALMWKRRAFVHQRRAFFFFN